MDLTHTSKVALATIVAVLAGSLSTAIAIQAPDTHGRFDGLVVGDPAGALDAATMSVASLPSSARTGWEAFRAAHGGEWAISIDRGELTPVHRGQPIAADGG